MAILISEFQAKLLYILVTILCVSAIYRPMPLRNVCIYLICMPTFIVEVFADSVWEALQQELRVTVQWVDRRLTRCVPTNSVFNTATEPRCLPFLRAIWEAFLAKKWYVSYAPTDGGALRLDSVMAVPFLEFDPQYKLFKMPYPPFTKGCINPFHPFYYSLHVVQENLIDKVDSELSPWRPVCSTKLL